VNSRSSAEDLHLDASERPVTGLDPSRNETISTDGKGSAALVVGNTSAALRRGDQHCACVTWSRLARHEQRLRRDRPRREGASPRQMRCDERTRAKEVVGGQPRRDAVPALAVATNLCGISKRPPERQGAGNTYLAGHITHPALGQDIMPSHSPSYTFACAQADQAVVAVPVREWIGPLRTVSELVLDT
jgi:hypothetical protein